MVAALRLRTGLPGRVARVALSVACLALAPPAFADGAGDGLPKATNRIMTIEYYSTALGHFFVTGIPEEVNLLDAGVIAGWTRTGEKFEVWFKSETDLVPVHRYFSDAFAPKSSHFYTALAHEHALLLAGTAWDYEGVVAHVRQPSASGACDAGRPVFRLYNNVLSGAPNHRYTVSEAIRDQMIALGWSPEGFGPDGVVACVPKD